MRRTGYEGGGGYGFWDRVRDERRAEREEAMREDTATCSPEELVDRLKGLDDAQLLDLEKMLGRRHRFQRAMLVNAYASVKRDFEGVRE